ncbi:MAG: Fic family protein [Pontiellaceae bacterium]|nr:Fic family protein [Pontiellaceae bacterium]MBN2785978.1 Fic family protein [Pontiellaceae bacterium]
MHILPPDLLRINEEKLAQIEERNRSIYRLIVFDRKYQSTCLLTRYLEAMEHLRDVISIKNAQQEAQSHEEAEEYLNNLKAGIALIVEQIAGQRTLESPADLFLLFRKIAPETAARTPNHFRQTLVQFGQCFGAEVREIPGLIEMLFEALQEIRHPAVKAIYLHHELVRIHPFTDGNGRLSRMAKNWMLMYNLYPPMFINDLTDKRKYIASLEGSFLSLQRTPLAFSGETEAFFESELQRLNASTGFILNRMLKNPDIVIDTDEHLFSNLTQASSDFSRE